MCLVEAKCEKIFGLLFSLVYFPALIIPIDESGLFLGLVYFLVVYLQTIDRFLNLAILLVY